MALAIVRTGSDFRHMTKLTENPRAVSTPARSLKDQRKGVKLTAEVMVMAEDLMKADNRTFNNLIEVLLIKAHRARFGRGNNSEEK